MARLQENQTDIDGPGGTALVTTAETVVATLPGLATSGPGGQVILEGQVEVNPGASTTGLQIRIRRGTTTAGAQVGGTVQVAAAATVLIPVGIQVDDNPGEVSNQQYVMTVQQIAATGNGTVTTANLSATVS